MPMDNVPQALAGRMNAPQGGASAPQGQPGPQGGGDKQQLLMQVLQLLQKLAMSDPAITEKVRAIGKELLMAMGMGGQPQGPQGPQPQGPQPQGPGVGGPSPTA